MASANSNAKKKELSPSTGAEEIRIGAKLRHTRLVNGMRLKDLADLAGCSESMVSKIENERVVPSLTTLHRLSKALKISVSALLHGEAHSAVSIVRSGARPVIGHAESEGNDRIHAEVIVPQADGRLLEGFIVVLQPNAFSGELRHKGEEAGYVLEGLLELTVSGSRFLLQPGDSFHFLSDLSHTYTNPGTRTTRVVWINTPPSF
jgi:transcriptional regulator with XRE-family HTH domain